jgi:putative ABC transport system substrate-binding protein
VKRRGFIGAAALGTLALQLGAGAQQSAKVYQVGFLSLTHGRSNYHSVFEEALREHGWINDRNIVFEYRFAEGRWDRLPAMAAELVQLGADVIEP